MRPNNPEDILNAKQMREKLGNCHSCAHASSGLDKCKERRPEFNDRFRAKCAHIEHNPTWFK